MRKTVWNGLVEVDRPFADLFRGLLNPWTFRPWITAAGGHPYPPTTDVFTRNGDIVVRVELPGIDPAKDVTVSLEDGELTVKGERKQDREISEEGFLRKESTFGYFERHVFVPEETKEAEIKATYSDGVLEIVVPKPKAAASKPKSRVIPVITPKPAKV